MLKSRFEPFTLLTASATKSIARIKAAQMEAFHLSGAHTACLCQLKETGSMTQRELTTRLEMDRSQVSRVLRTLVEQGYVVSDSSTGYKRRYALTPDGNQIAQQIETLILDINEYVSRSIPDEDIDVFYRTFETITENLRHAALHFTINNEE